MLIRAAPWIFRRMAFFAAGAEAVPASYRETVAPRTGFADMFRTMPMTPGTDVYLTVIVTLLLLNAMSVKRKSVREPSQSTGL